MAIYARVSERVTIGVGRLPERARIAIYLMDNSGLTPIAYFTKPEYADMFTRALWNIGYQPGDAE
jgi:hypothetical protein